MDRNGRLPARKVGTQHFIEEEDLDNLLQEDEVIGIPSA